jgi:hypothetical protein
MYVCMYVYTHTRTQKLVRLSEEAKGLGFRV